MFFEPYLGEKRKYLWQNFQDIKHNDMVTLAENKIFD